MFMKKEIYTDCTPYWYEGYEFVILNQHSVYANRLQVQFSYNVNRKIKSQ